MKTVDYILLALILGYCAYILFRRKKHTCGGCCSSCSGCCGNQKKSK